MPKSYVPQLAYFLRKVMHNNTMDTLLILKHFYNLHALQENYAESWNPPLSVSLIFILDLSNALLTDPCTVCRLQAPISIIEWKALSSRFRLNSFINLMFTAAPSMEIWNSFSESRCLMTSLSLSQRSTASEYPKKVKPR